MSTETARVTAFALWLTGLSAIARRLVAVHGRFVLELHGVPSRPYSELPAPVRPSLAAPDLERILRWLAVRFQFLSAEDLLGSDAPGVLLTFDDGFANNHDVVLPLLMRHRAPAVFFVATRHIGREGRRLTFVDTAVRSAWPNAEEVPLNIAHDLFDGMSEDQLRACAASGLVTIGAHSVSHPRLTTLADKALETEIVESRATLEALTGERVDLFAYPFGDADERVAAAVAGAGFRAAFVEQLLPISQAHLAIPRVGIHRPGRPYLAAKLSGLHDRPLSGRVIPA